MDKITHILENVVSCCRDANDSARRLVRRPKAIGESEHWRSSEQHSGNRGRLETTRQAGRNPDPEGKDEPVRLQKLEKANWPGHEQTGYRPQASGDRPPGWTLVKMGRYRPRPRLRPSRVGEDRVGRKQGRCTGQARTLKRYWSGPG